MFFIHPIIIKSAHKFTNLCRTTDDKTLKVGLGIYRKEGIRGLWRGVGPTSQRSGLLAGVQVRRTDGDLGGGSGSGFFYILIKTLISKVLIQEML